MELEILKDVGFKEKEAKIYLALLKLGPSSASKLGEHIGYDRTTTYYILLRMVENGYVTQIFKGTIKYFTAIEPKQILLKLKEREEIFKQVLPKLESLPQYQLSELRVETYKGKEGLNTLYRDVIRTGKELLALGVDESKFFEFDTLQFKQYLKYVNKGKIKERLLTFEGAKVFGSPNAEYRFVKKEFFQPTQIAVYGNKVASILWEPTLYIILIESKELASAFRKHFELLWKIAKKK